MQPKMWYQSWTIWANAIGLAIAILQLLPQYPIVTIPPIWMGFILAVLNMILRFKTEQPITVNKADTLPAPNGTGDAA